MRENYVPINMWGRDHWTTIVYVESRAVDFHGKLDNRHMRTDKDLHPQFAHHSTDKKYPTRLSRDRIQENHDDWSCLDDAREEGLLHILYDGGTAIGYLSDLGWFIVGKLRRYKAENVQESSYFHMISSAVQEEFDCLEKNYD